MAMTEDLDFGTNQLQVEVKEEISSDDDSDLELETLSSISHVDSTSVHSNQIDLNDFYNDLLQCQGDCETCQKYMRILSEHIRVTHAPQHPIQDPLLIDPLDINQENQDPPHVDQYLSVQMKCEVDEVMYNLECSEDESNSNFEYTEFESDRQSVNDSEMNPSDITSNNVTQNVTPERSLRIVGSSGCTSVKVERIHSFSSQELFNCDRCESSFTTSKYLTEHKKIHTGENPSRVKLTEHKRIHTGKKQFRCNKCEINFTNKSHLTRHNKRFHAGETGACSQKSSSTTRKRWRRKKNPHVYGCEVCSRAFTCQSSLTDHMRSHTGEKPFKCDECEKSFSLRGGLKIHKTIHTGERPFKCDGCERSFTRWKYLTEHKRIHQWRGKMFNCDLCMKCFKKQCALTLHMKIHN